MRNSFLSFSFGCRVNQAEKEEIDRQLFSAGFSYDEKNPSFYIINTCAVTAKAERETRQFINQVRKKYPKTKIVITGCAATKWLLENKMLDDGLLIIDNREKDSIIEILRSKAKFSPKILPASETSKFLPSKRLLLKIQDGCQRFCTYCIVPYLRGKPQSRKIKEVIEEINKAFVIPSERSKSRNLLQMPIIEAVDKRSLHAPDVTSGLVGMTNKNIKEVILTAINTEAYGFDSGESFVDLISSILHHTSIPRISLGSINPWSINDEFISFYKEILAQKRLVDFFHIPLQSGSNKILNLMKRDYSREEFLEKINSLVKINPIAFIGTDIIAGFLDENDEDFEDTYNLLSDSPISKFHIFRFSKREKTAAFYMAKNFKEPLEETKTKRAKILAELGRKKYEKFLIKNLGRISSALILEKRIGDFQEALLDNQISVLIKTNNNLIGEIKKVKVEAYKTNCLFGRFV